MDGSRMIVADSRQHARIRLRVIVDKVGPSTDISAGGIRVLTANPLPQGAEIRLAFELPEAEEPMQCHGRVVHVGPSSIDQDLSEMGIRYQRMMTRHRDAIRRYVSERADADDGES